MDYIFKVINIILNPFSKMFSDKMMEDITKKCTKNPWIIVLVSAFITVFLTFFYNIFVR